MGLFTWILFCWIFIKLDAPILCYVLSGISVGLHFIAVTNK